MARHFTELNIETFRSLKDLRIKELGDINILVGDNNSGKTSVLEAVQILCDPSIYNVVQVARQRENYRSSLRIGLPMLDLFMYMFAISSDTKSKSKYEIALSAVFRESNHSFKMNGEIIKQLIDIEVPERYEIVLNSTGSVPIKGQQEVRSFVGEITLQDGKYVSFELNEYTGLRRAENAEPLITVRNIQTIDHLVSDSFSNIIRAKDIKEKAISLLKHFDRNIDDLKYTKEEDKFVPMVESNLSEYLPLSMYGDGMKKALTILNALVSAENGVVLVDEFETAIHTSAMENVFKFMILAAKELNVQLFLTTHSIESIDKILRCAGKETDNIRLITLKRDTETRKTLSRNLAGSEVLKDRESFNFEVRQ